MSADLTRGSILANGHISAVLAVLTFKSDMIVLFMKEHVRSKNLMSHFRCLYLNEITTITTGKLVYDLLSQTRKIGLSYAKSVICISAYDRLSPSYASMYVIALRTSLDRYKSQKSKKSLPGWTFIHVFFC